MPFQLYEYEGREIDGQGTKLLKQSTWNSMQEAVDEIVRQQSSIFGEPREIIQYEVPMGSDVYCEVGNGYGGFVTYKIIFTSELWHNQQSLK